MSESENIDLPNNLCVAEAAFEKFQELSNYEEDEFITLSDIVDPPRPTLDINACLNEIQDDVSTVSVSDPQTDQNNPSANNVKTNEELLFSPPTSCDRESISITSSSIQTVQGVSEVPPQRTPKKRGRKKKNSNPSFNVTDQVNKSSESVIPTEQCVLGKGAEHDIDNTVSEETVCDRLSQSSSSEIDNSIRHPTRRRRKPLNNDTPIKSQPNFVAPEETLKRKRGRPKKITTQSVWHDQSQSKEDEVKKSSCQADTSHVNTSMEDNALDDSKNNDKSLLNMHQSTISVVNATQSLNSKTTRKRGRKKKSNIHNEDVNQCKSNDTNNTSSTEMSKQNLSVSSSNPVKEKCKNKEQDKKYDDIELELLRMLSTPTEELEQKLNEAETKSKEKNDVNDKEKPARKRGRNKKNKVEEADKYHEKSLKSDVTQVETEDKTKQDTDDETDDICLSSLKKRFKPEDDQNHENSSLITATDSINETSDNIMEMLPKRNSKKPIMTDFEYNVDNVVSESINKNIDEQGVENISNPETESPSKRPIRKKAKKVLDYDEGSDEDPFANVELSDDDDDHSSKRKGGRYYSDDEYVPGKNKKGKKYSESESSLSESDDLMLEEETCGKKFVKKKGRKSADTPKKNQNKKYDLTQNAIPDVTSTTADTTTLNDDELEHSLQSPDITTNENTNQKPSGAWGISHEFENFIAQKIQGTNLKIKKLTGTNSSESGIAPLEIPVIDPTEPKKTLEMSTQTNKISTNTVEVQTTSPHESVMKCKVPLSAKQSERACEFLKGIVRNTSELGQLMIQKSEDFIQKKINTKNITDTNKLEYCVQKSFLLFKLAKHNLIQMEDDLANEYEQFLKSHRMSEFRETPKCITASSKQTNSDSDCEIVEETVPEQVKEKDKSKFNLKTVFLNKELSIKIAKKSSEEPKAKKVKEGITGGRHTVWINDSVMVKKVKPTQSFLAQDSRNKKPPDNYISIDMVRKFFDNYYKRQKVLSICSPFVSPMWLNVKQIGICNYFIAQSNDLSNHSNILLTSQSGSETNIDGLDIGLKRNHMTQPTSLLAQCTKALNKYMKESKPHYEETWVTENNQHLPLKPKNQPKTLFKLSFNVVSNMLITKNNNMERKEIKFKSISSLKTLCLTRLNTYIQEPIVNRSLSDPEGSSNIMDIIQTQNNSISHINQNTNKHIRSDVKSLLSCCIESIQKTTLSFKKCGSLDLTTNKKNKWNAKSLLSCCLDIIQKKNLPTAEDNYLTNINEKRTFNGIKTLKFIAFENIKSHMYNNYRTLYNSSDIFGQMSPSTENYTENTCCMDKEDQLLSLTIKSVNTLSDDIFAKLPDTIDEAPSYSDDDNSNVSNYDDYEPQYTESNQHENAEESNWVSRVKLQELKSCFMPTDNNTKTALTKNSNNECILASIKIEPLEEASENIDPSIIKTEIAENDEIVYNPLETKLENSDNDAEDILPEQSSSSYDVDAFEEFARTNKMLQKADFDFINNEVFSQSASRVRKQHEPDMDDGFDTGMSLLIPQENTDVAKDRLMKSSSDEERNSQKNNVKKKRKTKPKISRLKNKDMTIPKNKSTPENEVALLTRKMQVRIRQEEKSEDSSDSESEDTLAKLKNDKFRKESEEKAKLQIDKDKMDTEIQCNDVDSTQNVNVNIGNKDKNVNEKRPWKTSLRKKTKGNNLTVGHGSTELDNSFGIQPDDPVELLECEPTFPMMDDDNMENIETETASDHIEERSLEPELQESAYIDRYGWKCYPVDDKDTKLYEHTFILLEKLPESFVETYFRYQGVADKDQEDADIDRLTNLQSLHRTFSKDNKVRSKANKINPNGQQKSNVTENSRVGSPTYDDNFNELTASEDEGANIDDEISPALSLNTTDNVMAKNSLMNDMESDSEKPGASEAEVNANKSVKKEKIEEPSSKKYRPGPKSKKATMTTENESTLLTADKMMNKELTLLHAPVTLDAQDIKVPDAPKKHSPKNVNKTSSRLRTQLERDKREDESSSEEEKQWVTTKEKLLKRLVKKQDPSVDDAKRAKIVSEFIEKRGDVQEKRGMNRSRKRRSRKKFLERKKQMSILNRELFGEPDTSYAGRKHSQAFGKGRRNIRKVIDKKSLARSTVIANMEEFERKRRLNMQQTRLREELGCEEGVNVLVINDEVCLEYDFNQMRPVVTIHPFFTKVMKAHQYEGVKFMWDACFESLEMVARGHPGGGCILAHCMGLGKTLQVLALLHTVLTHPGVGMKRVLVCCPLSTVLNWVDEINKWIGPVTTQIKVFELSKLKKTYERAYQLEDWYKDGGIFIIGYELFRSLTTLDSVLDEVKPKIVDKIRHALLNPGPDVVICDEGHLLKNDASVLAVAMSRVATKRRIVLTGTPMQNNLREYYCMVNFVKPNLLGTYSEYSNRFENPIMNGQHRDSQEDDIKLMKARTHILHKVLEGCLQRQEASVLYPYLPKKHEYTVFIPPTKCQWDLYKHYIMTYALEQQNKQQQNKQQKQSVLKDFHVLQKIWTHPQVLHNFLMKARDERNKMKEDKLEDDLAQEDLAASEDVKPTQSEVWWLQYLAGGDMLESLESSNKFVVVFKLLEEFITLGDKVLIFSTSLYTLDALEYFLKRINKWSLGQDYFRLDGSVPAEVRQKWCREFNAPHNVNTKLFLISTRAGCLGLNMTAANRVIILDTSWNPAHDIQSIFRVYRFGQKKDCYIYRLVAMGTMEQKIYERSVTKQAVSCRVVDEQQIDRHYNMAELTALYRYDEEGESVEAGFAAGVSDVALLRVAARARLHAVREHDSLLRGSREQHLPEHERNAAWMQFQQEHANNEMQDRLLEASQGIQRILEAEQPGSVPVKSEVVEQPQLIVPEPGPKSKRVNKKTASNSNPPVEDSKISVQKEMQLDAEKEEAKVKKIMQLLIKHNFHTSQQAHQISQLVRNVRAIVDAGGAGLAACDELTRSIATVMLQQEDICIPTTEPPPTDVITGDVDATPTPIDVKPEIPHEILYETSDGKVDDTPIEITGRVPYPNTSTDDALLVEVNHRRPRGRPRKYFHDEVFDTMSKRRRGRPRKNTTDTEQSSVEDDRNTLQTTPATSPNSVDTVQRKEDKVIISIGKKWKIPKRSKKSKRLKGKPPICYTSDADDGVEILSSKEQSPELDDAPLRVLANMQKNNRLNSRIVPESDVTIVDDEDSGSKDSEAYVVPDVEQVPGPEVNKPRRAIAVKSTAKSQGIKLNYNGKMKRKAAVAAEQHLETLNSEDVVTLDDDDDWVDDRVKSKVPSPPRGLTLRFDTEKNKNKTARNSEKSSQDVRSTKRGDASIIIDDEDRPKNNVQQAATNESASTETDEVVPLHPSMLSNANFIKIVAYAYQSNRMLDEDAALLAARYSTQKALKEYETTGKGITSGPLYDIAVKVLTKDVLKKLHEKKGSKRNEACVNSPRSQNTAQAAAGTRENPPQNYDQQSISSDYPSQPNVVPIGMFRGSSMNVASLNEKTHEASGECILPDDDDCILGTTDESVSIARPVYKKRNSQQFIITSVKATAAVQAEPETGSAAETIVPEIACPVMVSAPISLAKGSKHAPTVDPHVTITERPQLVLGPNTPTFRLSKSNLKIEPTSLGLEQSNLTNISRPPLTLTISEGKLIQPGARGGISNVAQSNRTPSDETICLDSDDEEVAPANALPQVVQLAPAPPAPAAPTPVAVTTSVPSLSRLNNVQGVRTRVNNVQTHDAAVIDAEAPTNGNEQLKSRPKKIIIHPPVSTVPPKLPKLVLKPGESSERNLSQPISKKVINPEDLLGNIQTDRSKKVCKPGDIVRISKQGNLSVLSRLEKVPESIISRLTIVPAGSSDDKKTQQKVADKLTPSASSTTHDPLSILKDVIHIRADEYDEPKLQPINKSSHNEANKQSMKPKTQNKEVGSKIKLQYPTNVMPDNKSKGSLLKKLTEKAGKVKKQEMGSYLKTEAKDKKRSAQTATIDLTHLLAGNTNVADVKKSTVKGAVVVGSSKDIIIRAKPSGSTVTKASTSVTNTNLKPTTIKREFECKKRTSPWPDPTSPKRKKNRLFRPAQTLEDFDIDDIDDIIELE